MVNLPPLSFTNSSPATSLGGASDTGATSANLNQSFGSSRTFIIVAGLVVLGALWVTRRRS